jgi:hypothetical protein
MKAIGHSLRCIDKIGPEIGYTFGRKPRFQTVLGGIMTLLAYSIIGFVAYTLLRKIFDSKEVDV